MKNVILSKGLSDTLLQQIGDLEKECCTEENLNFKLNWDMLNRRPPDEVNDFLFYENNKLVGFFGLYCIGPNPKVIEATGMVHPHYRRRGIFTELYNLAKQECISRGADKILLISERISEAGKCFAEAIDSKYTVSEFRMKFDSPKVNVLENSRITLRKSKLEDSKEIKELDALCFGALDGEVEESEGDTGSNQPVNDQDVVYIIELDGTNIGKIGVLTEKDSGYIFGFGIKPEYRGKGYGRQVLNMTLEKIFSERITTVLLEVAVENENALNLYKSCGFRVITVYDYYEINL